MFNDFKKQIYEKYSIFIVRIFLLSLMLLTGAPIKAQDAPSDGIADYQHVGTTLNPGAGLPLLDPPNSDISDISDPEIFDDKDKDGDNKETRTIKPNAPLSMKFRLNTPHSTIPTELEGQAGIDFFILLDISSSMYPSIDGAKKNIQSFLNTLDPKYNPRIALITFDSIDLEYVHKGPSNLQPTKGQWGISLKDVSNLSPNIGSIQERLNKINIHNLGYGHSEPGLLAIEMALNRIKGERKNPGGMERFYVIIMITDEVNYNHNGTSSKTTFLEKKINELKHQERVKLFASLGDFGSRHHYDEHGRLKPGYEHPINYVKKQFEALLKNSLTNVVPEDRGSIDIAFPFGEQALIHEIEPKIKKLFPAEPLSCTLKKVEVKTEDKNITFLVSEMRVERETDGPNMAYIDDILKGKGDASSVIDKEVTITVNRCCNKIQNNPDEPKEDGCWSESNKQIKYTFKEKEE